MIRGNQSAGSQDPVPDPKIIVPDPLPPCTIESYIAACKFGEGATGKEVTFDLGSLEEQFNLEDPKLRARADAILRKMSSFFGAHSIEAVGLSQHMRSFLGDSAMKFMLPIVVCTPSEDIMLVSAGQVAAMQESVRLVIEKERQLIATAGELQDLGETPTQERYDELVS